EVISAPQVNAVIPNGRATIEGGFQTWEVQDLVVKLKAGALPVPVEIVSEKFVGPTLGQDSIQKSKIAALVGYIAIFIYMVIAYRYAGVLSGITVLAFLAI